MGPFLSSSTVFLIVATERTSHHPYSFGDVHKIFGRISSSENHRNRSQYGSNHNPREAYQPHVQSRPISHPEAATDIAKPHSPQPKPPPIRTARFNEFHDYSFISPNRLGAQSPQ